ncbi:MAG: polyhydroxyalkanoic acid system family protein [Pseudomonadales bacterium]|nr:polyhydroxyalkanoic acid system family protein [Pseudomonadales bacterium]
MSTISLVHRHSMGEGALRIVLDKLASDLEKRFQLSSHWEDDACLRFKRKGADGCIRLCEGEIHLDMKLGLLLKAFSHRIESDMKEYMQAHIL